MTSESEKGGITRAAFNDVAQAVFSYDVPAALLGGLTADDFSSAVPRQEVTNDKAVFVLGADPNKQGQISLAYEGIETGFIKTGAAAAGAQSQEQKKKKEREEREFWERTLELARELAEINEQIAELGREMDEIAAKYLTEEEMKRKPGETDQQHYERQNVLMAEKYQNGEVPEDDFKEYQKIYRKIQTKFERKQEIEQELKKPEHQAALREIGARQQELDSRKQALDKRAGSNTQVLGQLQDLKNEPERSDTAMDVAFMQLLQQRPDVAVALDQRPDAADMTTEQKIEAAQEIVQKEQADLAQEAAEVKSEAEKVSVVSPDMINEQYAEDLNLEAPKAPPTDLMAAAGVGTLSLNG